MSLTLSRKVGQRIYIGEKIWIEVRKIKGKSVRLAIGAETAVKIVRGELRKEVA